MEFEQIQNLGIALGLGLLVGLQREWSSPEKAGIRTFALITLLGAIAGLLIDEAGSWILAAGWLSLAVLIAVGVFRASDDEDTPGLTTEVAALVMYGVGVLVMIESTVTAIILGGVVAVLLQWKQPLHSFVRQFAEGDIRAIFQFVLIALVILPILPDKDYGPYEVLNPYRIWLLVVLIVGISITAYIAQRFFGARAGALLGGLLGGLISSTATTVSYARQSQSKPSSASLATMVIMIASTIVFVRVIVIIGVIHSEILMDILPPIAVMAVAMAVIVAVQYVLVRKRESTLPVESAPSSLKPAIIFGAMYALVLLAVAAGREHLGDRGLYLIAAVSGLTDMDAITLSTARLIKENQLTVDTGWRMILIGYLSNLVFKGGIAAVLGNRKLFGYVAAMFAACMVIGVLLLLFWPAVDVSGAMEPIKDITETLPAG